MRFRWRLSIVAVGLLYSTFLWHQQDLTDQATAKQTQDAIGTAVQQANAHSDQRFQEMQGKVEGLGQKVDQDSQTFISQIGKTETDLNSSIGKVGKPGPPPVAKLVFTLWDEASTPEKPVLVKRIQPNDDGTFSVDFTIVNGSDTTAKGIDIWVRVCDLCTLAKEPDGFEKPKGIDDRTRHRHLGDLNPGVSWEKMTAVIKPPDNSPTFQVALTYSCENCGGHISAVQVATVWSSLYLSSPPVGSQ